MKSGDRVAVSAIRLSLSEIKNADDRQAPPPRGQRGRQHPALGREEAAGVDRDVRQGRPAGAGREGDRGDHGPRGAFSRPAWAPRSSRRSSPRRSPRPGPSSMKDIGKVMKSVLPRVAGRADGAEVNKLIRAKSRLSGPRRTSAVLHLVRHRTRFQARSGVLSLRYLRGSSLRSDPGGLPSAPPLRSCHAPSQHRESARGREGRNRSPAR